MSAPWSSGLGLVYVFVAMDGSRECYVGLTKNERRRLSEHKSENKFAKRVMSKRHRFIILETDIEHVHLGDAEKRHAQVLKDRGWKLLNDESKLGSIGGGFRNRRWTEHACRKAAALYNTRGKFFDGHNSAYNAARHLGILDEICAHMTSERKPNGYWTKDLCAVEAGKWSTRSIFHKASSDAYTAAHRAGWLDEICSHMIAGKRPNGTWTKEACAAEAQNHKFRAELQKNCISAYTVARNNGWLDEICQHMKLQRSPTGHWNKENCHKEALKHETKQSFRKGCVAAYSAAHKKGFINEICSHMS